MGVVAVVLGVCRGVELVMGAVLGVDVGRVVVILILGVCGVLVGVGLVMMTDGSMVVGRAGQMATSGSSSRSLQFCLVLEWLLLRCLHCRLSSLLGV